MKRAIIAIALTLAGCSGDYTEVVDGDELVDLDGTEETLTDWAYTGPPVPIDLEPNGPPPLPEGFESPAASPIEKGAYTVLQGWGIGKAHMQFQDGTPESYDMFTSASCTPGPFQPNCVTYPDFCSLTAATACDNEWHIQVNDLSVDHQADWDTMGEFMCGVDWSWFPCVYPKVTHASGGRAMTYSVDLSSCPADSTRRQLIRDGIDEALGKRAQVGGGPSAVSMWSDTGLTWTNVAPGTGKVNFRCEDALCPAGEAHCSQAFFYPIGTLTPLGSPDPLFNIIESCTSWDGSPVPKPQPYLAQSDLIYTYGAARVSIDWQGLWNTIGGGIPLRDAQRHVRNVMIHELGHFFGFHHTPLYFKTSYDVMGTPARADYHEYFRTTNLTFHPNLREAIGVLDMRTSSGLQVYDWDLSCHGPE